MINDRFNLRLFPNRVLCGVFMAIGLSACSSIPSTSPEQSSDSISENMIADPLTYQACVYPPSEMVMGGLFGKVGVVAISAYYLTVMLVKLVRIVLTAKDNVRTPVVSLNQMLKIKLDNAPVIAVFLDVIKLLKKVWHSLLFVSIDCHVC
ncbi:MAG: hypothetical protein ACTHUJ_08675 [Psychrobacter sp.]